MARKSNRKPIFVCDSSSEIIDSFLLFSYSNFFDQATPFSKIALKLVHADFGLFKC